MADKKLNIKVGLKGHKKAEKGLGKVNNSMKSLAKSALVAGGSFFAVQGIIRGLSTSVRIAGEQEQAEKRLSTALGHTSKALLDQASALQKVTTFGDESIIGVQASIAAFVDSEEQIKKATEATLDMAVAMGMDLKSAGDLIAKTLGSSTNALSRYGIQVEGAVGSTERLESLTSSVAKLFGGQAKAQANTYAGSVEQMKNSLGDMAEDMGKIVIPIFEKLAPHLRLAIDFWSEYLNKGKEIEPIESARAEQIARINRNIEYQTELIKDLADETGNLNGVSSKHQMLRVRAYNAGRTLVEQMQFELNMIQDLIVEKNELIELDKEDLRIKEALTHQSGIKLDIRRQELELDMNFQKVTPNLTKGNIDYGKSLLNIASVSGQAISNTSNLLATMAGEDKDRQIKAMRLAQLGAVASTAGGVAKALEQTGIYGIISGIAVGIAGAAQVAVIENAISDAQGFADGGIVPGQGTGDTVPAMLTPGEVILNKAQQENLVQGMGNITLNISAPLVDETVIDTIIPAIQKAQRMNLA